MMLFVRKIGRCVVLVFIWFMSCCIWLENYEMLMSLYMMLWLFWYVEFLVFGMVSVIVGFIEGCLSIMW